MVEWWNDVVDWIQSDDGWTIITGAVVPFLAILIGGLIAGGVARGATKRLMQQQDRQHKAAAVAALIAVGRRSAVWHTLSTAEKEHVEAQASEAEIRVRLLPLPGADLAAEWAEVQLASMKKNSATFSFQAEQDLQDYQNGLIAWQAKPSGPANCSLKTSRHGSTTTAASIATCSSASRCGRRVRTGKKTETVVLPVPEKA